MIPIVNEDIERYAEAHSTPDPPYLVEVAETTRTSTAVPQMMVGPLEGRFLATLVSMLQASRVLEIGTFTGYSALSMAAALPEGGRIVTCEVDEKHAALARRHFDASPFADRIELRFGPADDTLRVLEGPFDLVFIDADKEGYRTYYEAVLPMLSDHGVIAVDNVLWSGNVIKPDDSPATKALVDFNDFVRNDPRVECVMLTVRDGVTLIRRRPGPSGPLSGRSGPSGPLSGRSGPSGPSSSPA
jgi:caffeoyl-CoA O-methyltransferase